MCPIRFEPMWFLLKNVQYLVPFSHQRRAQQKNLLVLEPTQSRLVALLCFNFHAINQKRRFELFRFSIDVSSVLTLHQGRSSLTMAELMSWPNWFWWGWWSWRFFHWILLEKALKVSGSSECSNTFLCLLSPISSQHRKNHSCWARNNNAEHGEPRDLRTKRCQNKSGLNICIKHFVFSAFTCQKTIPPGNKLAVINSKQINCVILNSRSSYNQSCNFQRKRCKTCKTNNHHYYYG